MSGKFGKYGFFLLVPWAILIATAGVTIAAVPDAVVLPNSWLNISPGSDSSQLNFSWATLHADTTYIRALPDTSRYPILEPEVQIINASTGDTTTFYGTTS